jgi:hypothetical protein
MMKTLLVAAVAVVSLAGCVAVPVYSEPAPAYGYYAPPVVYAPPVATFSFGYNSYRGGPRRGYGPGPRYRH